MRKNAWLNPSCSRCGVALTDENWTPGLRREYKYRCNSCETTRVRIGRFKNLKRYKAATNERQRKARAAMSPEEKKQRRLARYPTAGRPRSDSVSSSPVNRYLWITYKITQKEYDLKLKSQNYRCAICRSVEPLVVDHCHDTGRVRDLLCNQCNLNLGHLEPRVKANTFTRAVEYLRKHGVEQPD
jgi:predicted SprT family Zn-dependent metalloprotease